MRRLLFLAMCAYSVFAHNQTVLNSSMEDPTPGLPGINTFSMDNCEHWSMSYNSSDWLTPVVGSTGMSFGYQPHSGVGHAGLAGTGTISGGNTYKEMITGTLTGLVSGQTYKISYFVRNDGGPTALDVGAYISSSIPTNFGGSPYSQVLFPQIEGTLPADGQYHEITGCFTANFSGTGYITIGVFKEYSDEIEGEVTNYIHVDDVTIQPVSAPLPVMSFTMDESYCPASDIIADWSASSGYASYSWFVSSANGGEIFASSGMQTGPNTSFDVGLTLTQAAEFPDVPNCYKVTLRLYNSSGCYVEHSENFCMINPSVTIQDNGQPHCEGTPFQLTATGAPSDWLYTWSDGQNGIGLTTINTNANSSTTTYSVAATTTSGCNSEALISGLVVHQNPNAAPTLVNAQTHYYVQQLEQICIDFYSTDSQNENIEISISSAYASTSTFNYFSTSIAGSPSNHEALTFCLEVSNFWQSGEYLFNVVLTDNNVCGPTTVKIPFKIDVLCPGCQENLYIDNRNPNNDPFFDGDIKAANTIYLGTLDLAPGHEVDPGNSGVHFTAKHIEVGPNWQGDATDYSWLPSYTCSDICDECCSPVSQLTYDAPPPIYHLTPNGDEVNDVFFVTDYSNPYDAYRSTAWQFTIWPYTGELIEWYPPNQVIWSHNSVNDPNQYSHACYIYETPTPESPYKTFFWDGTFKTSGSAWIADEFYFYSPGETVPPGVYRYVVDLFGCKNGPGAGIDGHSLQFEGLIFVYYSTKTAGDSTSINGQFYEMVNNELTTIDRISLENLEFNVYPNPTNGDLFLTIPVGLDAESTTVEIFDVTGKLVLTTNFSGQQYLLSLNELQRGSYFMRLTNGTDEFIEKIILD